MEAETTIRGLLGTACREGVELLDATACAISRVIGDLLVGVRVESGDPAWLTALDDLAGEREVGDQILVPVRERPARGRVLVEADE